MTRRARRERETMDYLAAARRFIRAAGVRVADSDEWELAELVALRAELEAAIVRGVSGQRSRGRSWAYVGAALGITRQSAQERYGAHSTDPS
ncbi:hypothetical protein [Microbacterium candidum]|uniref:Helix-turn-helix domain-containing protein n=1 Tax=Microbacterium candidum TaxID=3041922 RepID=A0ABT7MWN3_9MICO|nr:hypothetical protein [Microbacterium sp. ASV49]MDL9978859.1 hypothetical protein [Microbacterium sp. ASV49]